jgi:hypothetical protein
MVALSDNPVVYDKVKWYAANEDEFDNAISRFKALIPWLKAQGLLSERGMDELAGTVGYDTAICDYQLTDEGDELFKKCFKKWLIYEATDNPWEPTFKTFEKGLKKVRRNA